jgi:hypothetical protein
VVQSGAQRDVRAAVVPHDGEPLVAEMPHELDAISRHQAFRIGRVVGCRRRLRRPSVAAGIRADDGVLGREERSDPIPRHVRARVAVQQEHGRAGSSMAHAQRHLAEVDVLQIEPCEAQQTPSG